METKELLEKTTEELAHLLDEKRHEYRNLRFKASERQLKTVHTIESVRRDIARISAVIQKKKSVA